MLKHLFITVVVLLSLTGCVTSEESIDESTTSSSSSTLSSSSSSLSSLVSSSSSSMISSIVSSSSSSVLSSSSSTSSNSSSSISSSSSSSSTDTIITSSSSSSSLSSSSLSSLVSSSSSSSMSSSSISSSLSSSSSSTVSSSSSSISSLSSSSSSSISSSSSSVANVYLERVDIPQYDPDNPTHVLITTGNGMWTSSVLNDPNYKHFYVEPGRYATKINLTASGSKNSRRTISLYNGNDTHPAALSVSMVADVRIYFKGGSYWSVDRMAILDTELSYIIAFASKSAHNIINRLHAKNYSYGIVILPFCNYNTIQNSYINHMTHKGRMSDNVGIAIASNRIKGARTEGTKIINNDIRNANDGIQLVVSSGLTANDVTYPDTVIDSNRIWMDGDVYTDGNYSTNGYSPDGHYMIGENALDLKTGSDDLNRPVIITNNIMWGYQRVDQTPGGSYSGGSGQAIVVHYGVYHTKLNSNIVAFSQRALGIAALENGGPPHSSRYFEIKNNIFYKLNTINPEDDKTYAMYIYNSKDVSIENNTFVDVAANSRGSGYVVNFDKTTHSSFANNLLINTIGTRDSFGNSVEHNFLYSVQRYNFDGVQDVSFTDSSSAKMGDLVFEYERFTTRVKSKTMYGVVSSTQSPHYHKAGSSLE